MSKPVSKSSQMPINELRGLLQLVFSLLLVTCTTPVAAQAESIPTIPAIVKNTPVERVFDGTVEAVHQATISAQTSGRIAGVNYDVDDFVEHGSIVIQFTDVEQNAALRQADAALSEARARVIEAEQEYRRAKELKDRGLGSQRDLDRALAARDSAAARVASAESAVERANQELEYTLVRAPYAGIVTRRFVEVGESVSSGQPLMSGISLENLRVTLDLPQQVAMLVRPDPRATILTTEARVKPRNITVFPVADPVTNTFRVRLDLPDGQYGLYPGMFVKVGFQVGDRERLLVPESVLVQRSEVTAVYVVSDKGVRLRQIRIGKKFDDHVEVLAGLAAGEQVALDPVQAGILANQAVENQQ